MKESSVEGSSLKIAHQRTKSVATSLEARKKNKWVAALGSHSFYDGINIWNWIKKKMNEFYFFFNGLAI